MESNCLSIGTDNHATAAERHVLDCGFHNCLPFWRSDQPRPHAGYVPKLTYYCMNFLLFCEEFVFKLDYTQILSYISSSTEPTKS